MKFWRNCNMDEQAPYRLEELSPEEGAKLTADMQKVLEKYDAELGVTSSIQLLKRVSTSVLSPIQPNAEGENNIETPKAD